MRVLTIGIWGLNGEGSGRVTDTRIILFVWGELKERTPVWEAYNILH